MQLTPRMRDCVSLRISREAGMMSAAEQPSQTGLPGHW